jgi:hypothetical protein
MDLRREIARTAIHLRLTRSPLSGRKPARQELHSQAAIDVRPGVGEHSWTGASASKRQTTVEGAEHGDDGNVLDPLVGVTHSETDGLGHQRDARPAGPRLQLPLKVSAEDELFAESRRGGDGDPDGDLEGASRQPGTDGSRGVGSEKAVHQDRGHLRDDPERHGDRDVARDVLRARPPPADDPVKRRPAAGSEGPDVIEESPSRKGVRSSRPCAISGPEEAPLPSLRTSPSATA